MGWIRRLLGAQSSIPVFDRDSPRLKTPPRRPFVCRVASRSERGVTYTVEVDEADTWTCTCPDFTHERDVPGRPRYFCKHCISVGYITGLKRPKRWRRRGGVEEWLVGEILTLDDGTSRMQVDGFVTSRELYEVHDMTPALVKKFLPTPDEEAVFQSSDGDGEDEGGCSLYSEVRVNTVLNSVEYLAERQETERRREGARKGNAKRAATMARKRALEEKAEAEARVAFGGSIYLARCVYAYGWREYSVYAKDAEHARLLVEKWLRSEDGRSETTELHEDAVSEYQSAMEDYRDEKRSGTPDEELSRPRKPKKDEFRLKLEAVTKTDLDTTDYEIETVDWESEGRGWEHDIYIDNNDG